MTEIARPVGGPQVLNLRPSDANKPVDNSIDRFAPPSQSNGDASGPAQVREQIDAQKAEATAQRDPLELAAEKIQEFIPEGQIAPNTRLSIDQDDSGVFVYKNIDNESGETVRQFPSEEILKFLAFYREAEGIVVDDEV